MGLQTVFSLRAAGNILATSRKVNDPVLLEMLARARESGQIRQPVWLCVSDRAQAPMVFGYHASYVILPRGAGEWPVDRLRSVLLHELAHVRRSDWLWLLAARWNCILFWPNPGVWWAAIRLKSESEAAADDLVLATGIRPSDYAQHLLEVLREMPSRQRHAATTLAMAQGSEIHCRLAAILSPQVQRTQPRGIESMARVLVPMGLIGLGSLGISIRDEFPGRAAPFPQMLRGSNERLVAPPTGTLRLPGRTPARLAAKPAYSRPIPANVKSIAEAAVPGRTGLPAVLKPLPIFGATPELAGTPRDVRPARHAVLAGADTGKILAGGYAQEAFRWQVFALDVVRDSLDVLIGEGGLEVSAPRAVGTLTYSREFDGEPPSLWIRPVGGQSRLLLPEPAAPVWSPDGTRFVCSRWVATAPREGHFETYRYLADGSGRERLPLPEDVSVHDWEPQGRHLLVLSQSQHGKTRIETIREDGSGRTLLREGNRRFKQPRYSPDGSRVAFVALWNPAAGQPDDEVWVYQTATQREHLVFREAGVIPEVCWSPDGRKLAVVAVDAQATEQGRRIDGHTYRIETISATGGEKRLRARFPWMARVGTPVWTE